MRFGYTGTQESGDFNFRGLTKWDMQACPAPALSDSACIERMEVVLRRAAARGTDRCRAA